MTKAGARGSERFLPRAPWRPLLEGEEALAAAGAAREVLHALASLPRLAQPDLSDGSAGMAVALAYGAQALEDDPLRRAAERHLDEAIESLAGERMRAGMLVGFAGVAWAALALGADPQDVEEIDEALEAIASRPPWLLHFDAIEGAAGIGAYALTRLPDERMAGVLAALVDRLAELAVPLPGGGSGWWSYPGMLPAHHVERHPDGHLDLGLAHGIPGVLPVLAAAAAAGINEGKALALLEGAVAELLAHRTPSGGLPSWTVPNEPADDARVAWCYGPLGAARALQLAGRLAGRADWEAEALAMARHCAQVSEEASGVTDAPLCHGAAGIAHTFARLAQDSGDGQLAAAARDWHLRTLAMRTGPGIEGFPAWTVDDGHWHYAPLPNLLAGAAGVALALAAAVSPIEPWWDRPLLLSAGP